MAEFTDLLNRLPRFAILATSLIFALFLAAVDYLNGPYISLSIFYLIPLFIVTWHVGNLAGTAFALISAFLWSVDDIAKSCGLGKLVIPYWDIIMQCALLFVIIHVLLSLKNALHRESELARVDYLTKVANPRFFYEIAEGEINRLRRYKHPLTFAYLDIDDFKSVNDTMGHTVGDHLLSDIAGMIKKSVRSVDTVARMGGDEFAILMPETGEDGAKVVISRLTSSIKDAGKKSGWPVTVSIGMVTCEDDACSIDELIKRADALMYKVKGSGKNSIRSEVLKTAV